MDRKTFAQQFELIIDGYMQAKVDNVLDQYGSDLVPALEDLYDYSQGGKYIRPYMVYLGHLLVGGSMDTYELMQLGIINETIHNFALVHDDIVDQGETRRHKPCYHRILRDTYQDQHIGDGQAMLVGDLLLARAMQELALVENTQARNIITDMLQKVVIGELLDVHYSHLEREIEPEAIETKDNLKTAEYTFIGPLTFGAALADASSKNMQTLTTFGQQVGVAFQLRDDLLDRLPDDDGKTKFSDLHEGNQTIIRQYLIDKVTGVESQRLLSLRGNTITNEDRVWLRQLVDQYDLKSIMGSRINTMLDQAQVTLSNTDRDANAIELMKEIITYLHI